MDFFFAGNPFGNSGPRIVNRNFIRCLQGEVSYITLENRPLRFVEVIRKTLRSKLVIFSGLTSYDQLVILLCRLLGKKMVYIMHGFLSHENKLNGFNNPRGEKNEKKLLEYSNLILCVSETFMIFIKGLLPQYSHKISFLTNGVDWELFDRIPQSDIQRDNRRIVLLGGGRTTKRNLEVCEAVRLLNERFHENYHVAVYGNYRDNDQSQAISKMSCVTFCPVIPHDKLLEDFKSSFLFVQNSVFEPFSLGVIEALVCGCNLLISDKVGAKDIIHGITDIDIITDTSDIEQIAEKILYLSNNNNNNRLLASINKEETSIQNSARKLLDIAQSIA